LGDGKNLPPADRAPATAAFAVTHPYQGLDQRLTGVELARVVKELLA
jgi:hypothetical protein